MAREVFILRCCNFSGRVASHFDRTQAEGVQEVYQGDLNNGTQRLTELGIVYIGVDFGPHELVCAWLVSVQGKQYFGYAVRTSFKQRTDGIPGAAEAFEI